MGRVKLVMAELIQVREIAKVTIDLIRKSRLEFISSCYPTRIFY